MGNLSDIKLVNEIVSTFREGLDFMVFTALGNEQLKKIVFEDDSYYSKDILLLMVGSTFLGNLSCLLHTKCTDKTKFAKEACNNYVFGVCCMAAITSISLMELKETKLNETMDINDTIPATLFMMALAGALILNVFNLVKMLSDRREKHLYEQLQQYKTDYKDNESLEAPTKTFINVFKLDCAVGAIEQSFLASDPNQFIRQGLSYSTAGASMISAGLAICWQPKIKSVLLDGADTDSDNDINGGQPSLLEHSSFME